MRGAWRSVATAIVATLVAVLAGEVTLRLIGLGTPILYENRAAYGYRPLPDQMRRRLGGARIHVNALGLRGPDVAPAPPPGTLRLLFLGDSVTWGGSYVDDDDLFATVAAARVRERLPAGVTAVEALDAGVNAWGPQNVRGLVAESHGFASQVWVWTLLDDDMVREKTHFGEVPYFGRAPWSAWEELLVLASYRVLTRYKSAKPAADIDAVAAENLRACRDVAAQARADGVRLLIVWHPAESVLFGGPEPHREAVTAMAATEGVAFVDLTPAYRRAGDPRALYVDGMHLSRAGHRVAGDAIGKPLATLGASPP